MSASDLNQFANQVERIRRLPGDLRETVLLTFVSRKSFLCERINFSNDHSPSLFYYPRGKTTPPGSIPGLSKDISRVQHHRDDVQEHLLLVLYSDVTLQSPEINFGPEPHAFLRLRKRSLETNTSRSETKKVKLLMTPPKEEPSSQQIYDLAISSKIIFSQKTTPKFTSLFPGTSWPHITHVLGLPRIETSLFNTLLTSLIRTTKTMLKSSRFKCPEQLPAEYTLALSRMISRSLEIEFKTARQRCVRQDSKTPPPPSSPRATGERAHLVFVPHVCSEAEASQGPAPPLSSESDAQSDPALPSSPPLPPSSPEPPQDDDASHERVREVFFRKTILRAGLAELEARGCLQDISDSPVLSKIFFETPNLKFAVNYGTNDAGFMVRRPEIRHVYRHPNFPRSLCSYEGAFIPECSTERFKVSFDILPFIQYVKCQIAICEAQSQFGLTEAMSRKLF
jgi:hypothetical protein